MLAAYAATGGGTQCAAAQGGVTNHDELILITAIISLALLLATARWCFVTVRPPLLGDGRRATTNTVRARRRA